MENALSPCTFLPFPFSADSAFPPSPSVLQSLEGTVRYEHVTTFQLKDSNHRPMCSFPWPSRASHLMDWGQPHLCTEEKIILEEVRQQERRYLGPWMTSKDRAAHNAWSLPASTVTGELETLVPWESWHQYSQCPMDCLYQARFDFRF